MSTECLALNNETTRHSSHKKPDETCNLLLNDTVGPKGVMFTLCCCFAQTDTYNLVTFHSLCCCSALTNTYNLVSLYSHMSGDVSHVWKPAHKLIKQRCNCPGQLAKFEHWKIFLQDLCGPISSQTCRP